MKKSNKRHFLLLEVMIAIALVVLCVIPLLSPHLFVLKYQREFIDKVELDHTVNLLYADFVERLYKNEIPWEQIVGQADYEIDKSLLDRVGIEREPFKGKYQFKPIKNKPNPPADFSVYLYTLEFTFTRGDQKPLTYPYKVAIVRDLTRGEEEKEEQSDKTE